MNPEKENALNESLAMTKLTIDLLNQNKSIGYIADILGYSESNIKKRHNKILNKLSKLI